MPSPAREIDADLPERAGERMSPAWATVVRGDTVASATDCRRQRLPRP